MSFYKQPKGEKDQQLTEAFIMVEDLLMIEIEEATCKEDINDILYAETKSILSQYSFPLIDAEDVVDQFYKEKDFNIKGSE